MGEYNIGTYLQCARQEAELTHTKACELPDGKQICTIESLSRIENGKRDPRLCTLDGLLEKYGKKKSFGNSYLKTADYGVLLLDKELNIAIAESRYLDAKKILEQIKERLPEKFLTNQQYLATNHVMIGVELKEITTEESIKLFTEILHMTLPSFGTPNFKEAVISQREAIIILQIGNAYGGVKNYEKALEILETTYANLTRYPDKFRYADGIYAVYMRAIIKWKGEIGAVQEALEMTEKEIENMFRHRYMDTLAGLLYAKSYNLDAILKEGEKTEEKCSEINSGYEVAALISELFGDEVRRDFIREKIK